MLRRRTAQGAATAALLTGVLALSACTGPVWSTPEPTATRSLSDSPGSPTTPASSPTPSLDLWALPERPAVMDTPSPAGAAAAAAYYLGVYEYAYTTGDTDLLRQMSADTCVFCGSALDDIEQSRAAAESEEGGGAIVEYADGTEISASEWYTATLRIHQLASTRRSADGDVLVQTPGSRHDLYFALSWIDGWRVDEVDVFEPGKLTPQ